MRFISYRHTIIICIVATMVLLMSANAKATIIYTNDFQGIIGNEWSNTSTETPPLDANRRFLGRFANDTIGLSLSNIPTHSELIVEFDLLITSSWDGDGPEPGTPDIWTLQVSDGPVLLHTTYSNFPNRTQDFPDTYDNVPGGATNPPKTGAVEINTLGYPGFLNFPGGDSVYHLIFSFPHTKNSITLNFIGGPGLTSAADEGWGIDNILVSGVPLPPSGWFFLSGLCTLFVKSRKRYI